MALDAPDRAMDRVLLHTTRTVVGVAVVAKGTDGTPNSPTQVAGDNAMRLAVRTVRGVPGCCGVEAQRVAMGTAGVLAGMGRWMRANVVFAIVIVPGFCWL